MTAPETGLHKAAVLMVLLGEDAASEIYRHLPQGEVERITQEISALDHVNPEAGLAVLAQANANPDAVLNLIKQG